MRPPGFRQEVYWPHGAPLGLPDGILEGMVAESDCLDAIPPVDNPSDILAEDGAQNSSE